MNQLYAVVLEASQEQVRDLTERLAVVLDGQYPQAIDAMRGIVSRWETQEGPDHRVNFYWDVVALERLVPAVFVAVRFWAREVTNG